jgi:hypothetical protein
MDKNLTTRVIKALTNAQEKLKGPWGGPWTGPLIIKDKPVIATLCQHPFALLGLRNFGLHSLIHLWNYIDIHGTREEVEIWCYKWKERVSSLSNPARDTLTALINQSLQRLSLNELSAQETEPSNPMFKIEKNIPVKPRALTKELSAFHETLLQMEPGDSFFIEGDREAKTPIEKLTQRWRSRAYSFGRRNLQGARFTARGYQRPYGVRLWRIS